LTNGVGIGYQANNSSIFYTVEQEIFNAVENHGNISNCMLNVGMDELEMEVRSIFPNPCSAFINVPICSSANGCLIEIFAMDGRKVKNIRIENGETRIDINDLKKGMYVLTVNETSYKFIK
jgi:hypothetical protein